MKNISRLLSLILAMQMTLSVIVFAEDAPVAVSEDILKKFELFQALAICDTTDIDLHKQVTRAEFVKDRKSVV